MRDGFPSRTKKEPVPVWRLALVLRLGSPKQVYPDGWTGSPRARRASIVDAVIPCLISAKHSTKPLLVKRSSHHANGTRLLGPRGCSCGLWRLPELFVRAGPRYTSHPLNPQRSHLGPQASCFCTLSCSYTILSVPRHAESAVPRVRKTSPNQPRRSAGAPMRCNNLPLMVSYAYGI